MVDLIFGCMLPLCVTRWKPALSVNGPTRTILDGLFRFLVGIVEAIDSESNSRVVGCFSSTRLGEVLV